MSFPSRVRYFQNNSTVDWNRPVYWDLDIPYSHEEVVETCEAARWRGGMRRGRGGQTRRAAGRGGQVRRSGGRRGSRTQEQRDDGAYGIPNNVMDFADHIISGLDLPVEREEIVRSETSQLTREDLLNMRRHYRRLSQKHERSRLMRNIESQLAAIMMNPPLVRVHPRRVLPDRAFQDVLLAEPIEEDAMPILGIEQPQEEEEFD
ncbi:hypothetical protein GCK72_000282 [Caenorhabditis remanei]|uniref:Uncharacterized protein n=1 Tax=Caenorhabditis remanei TaxID=31234 RepID=A0A6A5HJW5_CAERE|nr:hypothetical protein GCK72_000282 [Caenorhabditis remanei]KAF1768470.1 hypothetical protein GCK72_000282 [Caenorhabditis remanei]